MNTDRTFATILENEKHYKYLQFFAKSANIQHFLKFPKPNKLFIIRLFHNFIHSPPYSRNLCVVVLRPERERRRGVVHEEHAGGQPAGDLRGASEPAVGGCLELCD